MGEVVDVGDFYDPWDPKVTCKFLEQGTLDSLRDVYREFVVRWRRVVAGEPARWAFADVLCLRKDGPDV